MCLIVKGSGDGGFRKGGPAGLQLSVYVSAPASGGMQIRADGAVEKTYLPGE